MAQKREFNNMVIFSYDLETTGLDFVKDRPIEVGAILYSTTQKKCLESQGFLVKADVLISSEITKLTGITQSAVDKFGIESDDALATVVDMMSIADAVIGHNVVRFDKRMTQAWADREQTIELPDKLWIDTYNDLTKEDKSGREITPGKLTLMAAEAGFLNAFPHSALSDCMTVVKLIENFDFEKVVERAKSPMVVVQAHQARHENDLAKKARFRRLPEKKLWWKFVKEIDLEAFAKDLPFDISVHRENIEEFQDL
jgi:DNA polymerase III alpha subunit (gram-positive type)